MKMKDLIRESWFDGKDSKPRINIKEFLENVKQYSKYGSLIYRKGNISELAQKLSVIAETARVHAVDMTENSFDKITVSRNMKELKGHSTQFQKFAKEAQSLQERMESLYEDMGSILNRYYQIDEGE